MKLGWEQNDEEGGGKIRVDTGALAFQNSI